MVRFDGRRCREGVWVWRECGVEYVVWCDVSVVQGWVCVCDVVVLYWRGVLWVRVRVRVRVRVQLW